METSPRPDWPPHTARQVRLTCIDDRLGSGPFTQEYGTAYEVRLAGGALALTDGRRDVVMRELLVPKALGPLETVWLEVHLACGAVGLAGHHFDSPEAEQRGLAAILEAAAQAVQAAVPDVVVRTRMATPTGDSVAGWPPPTDTAT
ncbi:MAG: hypothetical protein ACP5QO_03770 [Clostridia bacterium]